MRRAFNRFLKTSAYLPFLKHMLNQGKGHLLIDEKIYSFIEKSSVTRELCSKLDRVVTYPNPQGGQLKENPFIRTKVGSDLFRRSKIQNLIIW